MTPKLDALGLFTDFGLADSYQGEMKAALYAAGLSLPLYDLMPAAPRFNPRASAYLLAALLDHLPLRQMLIGVVDPGVGSARQVLLLEGAGHVLIGPDNGLLALVARRCAARVWVIGWRPESLSASFHGRDLFVPAALRYLRGEELGLSPLEPKAMQGAHWPDDLAELIHVDGFGNLITGIRAAGWPSESLLLLDGQKIAQARTFSDCAPGQLFWYANSAGLMEIAANQSSAANRLGLGVGCPVQVI
jgi:S-adenosylmethionine hydrolase